MNRSIPAAAPIAAPDRDSHANIRSLANQGSDSSLIGEAMSRVLISKASRAQVFKAMACSSNSRSRQDMKCSTNQFFY